MMAPLVGREESGPLTACGEVNRHHHFLTTVVVERNRSNRQPRVLGSPPVVLPR